MKNIVGFSGGVASSVLAKKVYEEYPDDTILLFHDTKTEPEDNSRFRKEVPDYIGCPITEDSDGRDIWKVFEDEGYLGNGRNTCCSRILKQKRSLNFIKSHQPAILYIGFTSDEYRRAQRTLARYALKGIQVLFPLIERKVSKSECFHQVTNCWNITPPEMYEWADHANCIPCVKGKLAYWGLVYMYEREAWEKTAEKEKQFGHTIFTEAGSLEEELQHCLQLAREHQQKRDQQNRQGNLFELPCECT